MAPLDLSRNQRPIPLILDLHAEDASILFLRRDAAVNAPHYNHEFLARLDEQVAAHLDGLRVGGAMVSTQHANFIVNVGDATAADVHALAAQVRERVREVHDVDLELEVRVWGEDA